MKAKKQNLIFTIIFSVLSLLYVVPLVIVLINSLKKKAFVSRYPFALPNSRSFAGISNYRGGIEKTEFFRAMGGSLIITVLSVMLIILCTSMCAWYIIRVRNKLTKLMYFLFVFSMVVPFQMVMFTLSKTADFLHLNNPVGISLVYLGFGAGLAVFMFSGFLKSIPLEIEEAAAIDGCGPVRTFFVVVVPILKPTLISVTILQTMWIWNDYLLPYLVLDRKRYSTIPIAVQYLRGGYGAVDMGAMMAVLVLSIVPILVFYFFCQKYIVKGVLAGAVKG
ncbi:MAG: carbohydrate ABC transporter permease [Ruminococcus sp.]|nr:carbohydrate ABC transporter permease [Ruminococcus sp.]